MGSEKKALISQVLKQRQLLDLRIKVNEQLPRTIYVAIDALARANSSSFCVLSRRYIPRVVTGPVRVIWMNYRNDRRMCDGTPSIFYIGGYISVTKT